MAGYDTRYAQKTDVYFPGVYACSYRRILLGVYAQNGDRLFQAYTPKKIHPQIISDRENVGSTGCWKGLQHPLELFERVGQRWAGHSVGCTV